MIRSLLLIISGFFVSSASAQWGSQNTQYFDGPDSIPYQILNTPGNIWQVGDPDKLLFTSSLSSPNAIVTDTANSYPINNVSTFIIKVPIDYYWGILAVQWSQKIDIEYGEDGGIIEYSADTGNTWNNVFNDPYVYNFYGFDQSNSGLITGTGEMAFMGRDTMWRDIWLCFDLSAFWDLDTLQFRYTLKTDGNSTYREGWMIDNILSHRTSIHTINTRKTHEYMTVYPSYTDGELNIETEKIMDYHIIESLELMDLKGAVVKRYNNIPTKFTINISDQKPGMYFLNVTTNIKSMSFPVFLKN